MSLKDSESLKRALAELGAGFEPVRELGRGATSIVYLVRDHALGRDMAVKVIRSAFGPDAESVARLEREARLVAQLQHPNIVRLFGTRTLADGSLVLLMEHVPGRNLKELLRGEGALDAPRALGILEDVASALAYAHRRRIVHRDVKPENIYLDEEVGTARLADFGVAKPWDRDTRLTLPGESLGTPAYMSPEQIDDRDVDGRSDVYSLGLVGYEMLAGRHPWESDNLFSIIFKQKNEELPPLASLRRDVPDALVRILERALEKDPGRRWASAEEFLGALKEFQQRGRSGGFSLFGESAPAPEPPVQREQPPAPEPPVAREAPPPEPHVAHVPPPAPGAPTPTAPVRDEVPEHPQTPPSWVDASWEQEGPSRPVPPPAASRRRGRRTPRRLGRWAAGAVLLLGTLGAGWWLTSRGDAFDVDLPGGALASPASEPNPAPGVGDATDAEELVLSAAGPVVVEGRAGDVVPVEVRVRDARGEARADVAVRFQGLPDGAVAQPDSVTTDSLGLARTGVLLPPAPGLSEIVATLATNRERRVRFELRVAPGAPAALVPFFGGGQEGVPGELLAQALGVRVTDAAGYPVPGVPVAFQSLSGGGALLPARALTDSLGRAFARWRLGSGEETQQARAVVEDGDGVEAALFEARALAAPGPEDTESEPPAPDTATPGEAGTTGGGASPVRESPAPVSVAARPFAVGGTHVCRTAGPRVVCRGASDRGQARTGATPSPMVALAVGVSHTCSLDAEGVAFCWGANESGQVGDGTRTDRGEPTRVGGGVPFQLLAAGLSHTCGLDGRGVAHCWGRNVAGQLGVGTRDDHALPRPVAGDQRFRTLAAGWNHTCALDGTGSVWCWGLNGDGQLGDGSRLDRLAPTRIPAAPPFQLLAAGNAHTCGVTGGEVRCWGDNRFGQLGTGGTDAAVRPSGAVELPGPAVRVVTGAVHSCALVAEGQVLCWGQNLHGQLGDGTTTHRSSPTPVAGDLRFRTLEAGGGMTCGVATDGREYCWGLNQAGQLGDGTRTSRAVPTPVGG